MNYLLDGDLNQMSIQKSKLLTKGITIEQHDIYPAISSQEDYVRALRVIWYDKIEGWWNYKGQFIKYGICSEEQFKKGFND
jgi:hypothetical protein